MSGFEVDSRACQALRKTAPRAEMSIKLLADLGSTLLNSTEILTDKGWKRGVSLPKPIHSHCMLLLNQSAAMVIGGASATGQSLRDTWILDTAMEKWLPGPELAIGRMILG